MAGEGDAERLVVLLEARVRDFEKNLQKASGTARRRFDEINRGASQSARKMETDLAASSARVTTILSGFGKGLVLGAAGGLALGALAELP
ncbi:MAG: hypothetical protein J0H54_03685, partial [Rhizobiales bacterium]|nr:hypothetical protein [Hyphomicrobiales bacterium]